MPARLQAEQAGVAPLAGELLEAMQRVLGRRAPLSLAACCRVHARWAVPLHSDDSDAVGRVGDDRVNSVGVELLKCAEAVGVRDFPCR
jgi:hypothetical protein